jgi:hypothetical protein
MEHQFPVTFVINVKPEVFVKERLVIGPIWVEMEGYSFPGTEWPDFPVAILGFWLTNIKPLMVEESTTCECPFMDGPFQFNIRVAVHDHWVVTFIERHAGKERSLTTATVNRELLVAQLLSAAKTVVDHCRREQWIDDDLLNLETRLTSWMNNART